jgi:imidazoleglycerol-phosphate dehydratase
LSRNEAISIGRALARALRETGVSGLSRRQRGDLRALAVQLRQRDGAWQQALREHLQSQFDHRADTAVEAAFGARRAERTRTTRETNVTVRLNMDGTGQTSVHTGIGMLDHLLRQLAFHGLLDLEIVATGDIEVDAHHLTEDVALTLGETLDEALGAREAITRFSSIMLPMDEALATVALDLGGRGYSRVDASFLSPSVGQLPTSLIRHFLDSFARQGRLTLHAQLTGHDDDHHGAEALFKALGRAIATASAIDPRRMGQVPSTKAAI